MRGGLWVSSVHTLHEPKPVITFVFEVLSATQRTASVHTLHMPKLPVIQSATHRTASVHASTHAQTCD